MKGSTIGVMDDLPAAGRARLGPGPGYRRTLLSCAVLLVANLGPRAQDEPGTEFAFVETYTPRTTVFVQEPIGLQLRFGFERRFLTDQLIPLFRQVLDLPVQLQAEWIDELPGTFDLGAAAPDPERPPDTEEEARFSFALNDALAQADRVDDQVRGGRRFAVFQIERRYLPRYPGELVVPAPTLHFAFATEFRDDLLDGRVAADRSEALVHGQPLALDVQPLPREGRPTAFTGAVGRFVMRAEADPRRLVAGTRMSLTLRIEGQGNLAFFDPPQLRDLAGFHVLGRTDECDPACRTITYGLAPRDERVREVPAIDFWYFDPQPPAGYRVVRTDPIPIEVLAAPADAGGEPDARPFRND